MTETGQVTKVEGTQAVVRIARKEACAHCNLCKEGQQGMDLTLDNPLGAKEGDRVEITMGDRMVLNASIIVYAIPLLFLLIGAGVGYAFFSPTFGIADRNLSAAICGIVATIVSYAIVSVLDKRVSGKAGYMPRITRILDKEE